MRPPDDASNGARVTAPQRTTGPARRRSPRPDGRRAATGLLTTALVVAVLTSCTTEPDPGSATTRSTTTARAPAPARELVPATVGDLDVVATDYRFAITPDPSQPVAAGWTRVHLRNDGREAHQIMFARIKDGVDMAELSKAAAGDSSGAGAIAFVDMLGGVSYIGPGHEITALVRLPAGTVMAMCYVPDAHGVAHALMGMTATLTVADAPAERTRATAPVQGTIELAHGGYRFPKAMPAGWYHVVNTDEGDAGSGLHELSLMRLGEPLSDPKATRVVAALAANRDPGVALEAVGGMGALSPGFDGYVHLDLDHDPHLAVDFMPDPGEPRPHMLDGYHATVTP